MTNKVIKHAPPNLKVCRNKRKIGKSKKEENMSFYQNLLNQVIEEKYSNVIFFHQILQKSGAWKSMLNQFMKEKHSNVTFFHQVLNQEVTWKYILIQFMKEKHSNVTYDPQILQINVSWITILHKLIKKKTLGLDIQSIPK